MITIVALYIITMLTAFFSLYIKIFWLDKNIFNLQSEYLINNIFFWGMFGVFILISFYRLVRDRRIIFELINAFDDLKNINTDNIDEHYLELNKKFLDDKRYKYLNKNWRAFKSSLFSIRENTYYQSVDAEEFYNRENLLQEKMNFKLMNYIPQLLVGLGMLGTFLGLSIGLADLNLGTDDMSQLMTLITGTKTAFYTSLYGMYFSIAISIILNIYFGFYEEKILILKNAINSIFKRYLKDEKIEEIKNEMILVRKNTEELSSNVGKELVKGVQEYNNSSKEHLHNLTELVNTNISGLAENVSGAFEEKLEKIFSKDFIVPFIEMKDKLIEISEYNNKEITRYTNIISNINEQISQVRDSFQLFSKTTLPEFNSIIDRIENKYSEINKSAEESKNIYIKYIELLNNSKDIITLSNQNLEKLEKVSNIFTSFSDQEKKLVEFWDNNKMIMNSLVKTLEETKEKEFEKIKNYHNNILEKLDEYYKIFNNRVLEQEEKMAEYYKKHLEELFFEYDNSMGKAIIIFKDILKELGEKLEKTDDNLKNSNELIEKERKVFEEKFKISKETCACEMDKTTSEYENLMKYLNSLSQDIKDNLVETMKIVKEKNNEISELKKENNIESLIETNNNIFKKIEDLNKNLDNRLEDYCSFSREEKNILKESCFELIKIIKTIENTQNNFNENLFKRNEQQEEMILTLKKILSLNNAKPSRMSRYITKR